MTVYIEKLKVLAEAAERMKPGRWFVHRDGLGSNFEPHPHQNFGVDDGQGCVVVWHGVERLGGIPHEEVAEFIAAANPATVLELIAQNEALRKDAERYRWLRSRDLDTIIQGGVFVGMTPQNMVLNEETLDEEVDAAMSKDASHD